MALMGCGSKDIGNCALKTSATAFSICVRGLLANTKYNSFHEYPHLEARLRQRTSPAEANVALQALFRRDELDPLARIELFNEVAEYFRSIVKFPQEATEGISDEQYIRNVVDVLWSKRISNRQGHSKP